MTSSRLNFEYKHPVDGYIRLNEASGVVRLQCRWPFDLQNDDWIDISNEFYIDDYVQAVRDASEKGYGKAPGLQGGSIEIEETRDGFTLDFSNPYKGWQKKSLRIEVKQSLSSLRLQD